MEEIATFIIAFIVCLARLVFVPILVLFALVATAAVKFWTWLRTLGHTKVVLLWIPPWRRQLLQDVMREAAGESTTRPATDVLADVLSFDLRGWARVARKLGYRIPQPGEPLVPPTGNPTAWLQFMLTRGARCMIFEQDYVPEGDKVVLRILNREKRGTQGVFVGDLYGIRCELPDMLLQDGVPAVNVGDSILFEVTEFRGRSASVRVISRDTDNTETFCRPARRPFMVVASPWVYLELAPVTVNGATVLRVEELRLPASRQLPGRMRELHRLVVQNGARLNPRSFVVLGREFPQVGVCGPLPPGYPISPEFRRPAEFTVAAAFSALFETVQVLWRNRSIHARLWRELRTGDVMCGPGSLLRFVCLEALPGADAREFWSFRVGDVLLHYKGGATGPSTMLAVGERVYQNARGESYYWAEPWSGAEPTSVRNDTESWWAAHVSASKVERGGFDRYARDLDEYLFALDGGVVNGPTGPRLIPVTADRMAMRGGELVIQASDATELQTGDAVYLFDAIQERVAGGAVSQIRGRRVWLKIKWAELNADGIRFLMADPDDIPTRVQRSAIAQVRADRSTGNFTATNLLSCGRWLVGFPWLWYQPPPRSLWNERLRDNPSALAALRVALNEATRVALIQGPPGTGKTTFIVELILQLVLNQHKKVLLVSQGNLAADEALTRVARATDRILAVRVGDREKIDPAVRALHYDWSEPATRTALRERLAIKGVTTLVRVWDAGGLLALGRDMAVAGDESAGERAEWEHVAAHVDLVCATCIGIGTRRAFPFGDRTYDVVILDEASRATQTESLVPLRLGRRWVLVGDHHQLPPTVLPEVRTGLAAAGVGDAYADVSLFEVLQGGKAAGRLSAAPFRVHASRRAMLTTQYRMHPAIAELVATVFYDGAPIVSAGDALGRGLSLTPFEAPICVIDTRDWPRAGERRAGDFPLNEEVRSARLETEKSLANPLEVRLVLDTVRALASASATISMEELGQIMNKVGSDVGRITFAVITPYREQVASIREALGTVRDWGLLLNEDDSVATVDSYQGKERDVVILSTVRTARSERANLEFLKDVRRLNVAFSRARHKLILIGDGATLERADRGIMTERGQAVFERLLSSVYHNDSLQRLWPVPPILSRNQS